MVRESGDWQRTEAAGQLCFECDLQIDYYFGAFCEEAKNFSFKFCSKGLLAPPPAPNDFFLSRNFSR